MNKTEFEAAWGRYWDNLKTGLPLGDSPAYPIARTVRMPEGYAYGTGALSFRMTELKLHGADRLAFARCETDCTNVNRLHLSLGLEGVRLSGTYAVETKYDPIVELDTAGNLMDLSPEALHKAEAGADPDDPEIDPQQEQWLDQARDQRTKLQQTDNGLKMMGLYNVHNETYEEVFRENSALTPLWRADGATKEMAADTSDAVKIDGVVNKADKTYSGGVTYNMNAFVQQLNVASACVWQDPDFDPEKGPSPDSKYWAAAKAALSFGKGVTTTTDNTKDNVKEIKASDVHGTVEKHDQDLPPVSDEEMMDVIAQGNGPGGGEAARKPDWIVLDEQDRKRLRSLFEATMRLKAEKAAYAGQPLFVGEVEANIGEVDAFLALQFEQGADGMMLRTEEVRIEMPAYELHIEDDAWSGEAAEVARRRLEGMHFIRSLLHESIVDRLKRELADAVRFALPAAVRMS